MEYIDIKKTTLNIFYLFSIMTFFLLLKKSGIPDGLREKFLITALLFGILTLLLNYKEFIYSIKQFKNKAIKTELYESLRGRPNFSFKSFELIKDNSTTIIFFAVFIGLMMIIINYHDQFIYYFMKVIPYLVLVYFIFSLKLKLDSRIPIALALGLLLLTAITLIRGLESTANQLAIFAYYLLAVGVVLQLIEYIRNPEERIDCL